MVNKMETTKTRIASIKNFVKSCSKIGVLISANVTANELPDMDFFTVFVVESIKSGSYPAVNILTTLDIAKLRYVWDRLDR
jgi:hypothetical protein